MNYKYFAFILTIAFMWGCGGGGGLKPSVDDVTRDDGVVLGDLSSSESVSADASNASMRITFSDSMNPDSISTDNITLTCGESAIELVIAPADEEDRVFVVTPQSDLPQARECVLLVRSDVKDSQGSTMEADYLYTFQTACRTSDDFSEDTIALGCWDNTDIGLFAEFPGGVYLDDIFEAGDTADGLLNIGHPGGLDLGGDGYAFSAIWKKFDAENLTVELTIDELASERSSAIALGIMTEDRATIGLVYIQYDAHGSEPLAYRMGVMSTQDGGDPFLISTANPIPPDQNTEMGFTLTGPITLRITKEGDSITLDGNFADEVYNAPYVFAGNIEGNYFIDIGIAIGEDEDSFFSIDSVEFDAAAIGQE